MSSVDTGVVSPESAIKHITDDYGTAVEVAQPVRLAPDDFGFEIGPKDWWRRMRGLDVLDEVGETE